MSTTADGSITLSSGPLNLDVTTSLETSVTVDNFVEKRHELMINLDAERKDEILETNKYPLHFVDGHSYCVKLMVQLRNDDRIVKLVNEDVPAGISRGVQAFLGGNSLLDRYIDPEGGLTINVRLTVKFSKTYRQDDNISENFDVFASHSLSNDLKDLRKNGEYLADVTIKCQTQTFPAHKTILGARSDVLSAMFMHGDTKEAKTKQVEMDDTDPETVVRFLKHVYGGTVTGLNFKEARSLMVLVDKYNAKGLLLVCRDIILEILSDNNLVHIAILGDQLQDRILKEAAMRMMVSSGKSFKELDDWEELRNYTELMSFEMFEYYSSVKK